MKKLTFLILGSLLLGTTVYAAPYFRQEAGLVPITDSIYYLGTTTPATKAWKGLIVDEICLTADTCKTAWPTASGSFLATTSPWTIGQVAYVSSNSAVTSVATSSLAASTGISIANASSAFVIGSQPSFSIDQTFSPTWTGAHIFDNITRSTTTQATSTNFFSTNGVFGNLLPSSNDSGALGASGTAFSDLFLASGGVINWNAGDITLTHSADTLTLGGGTLALGSNTLTSSGTLTLTGTIDIQSGALRIPNSTGPTLNVGGRIALDTTSNNLVVATTTTGHFVAASATTTLYGLSVASTSPDFVSGGIIEFPAHFLPQVVTGVICKVDAGTSVVVNLSDGTNDTNTATCTTTETQYAITSNNSWTAYERVRLELGTVTGTVDYLVLRWIGYRTSD